jgi:MBG domain (YGX type)/Galactose oxidase, central domain
MFSTRLRTVVVAAVLVSCAYATLRGQMPQVANGAWQPAGSLGSVRAGAASALLSDGSMLVTGGADANGSLATSELFGTNGTFSAVASMNAARADHTAVTLADGRVLVVGGRDASGALLGAEVYSSGAWSAVGDLTDARWGHTATLLEDGRVLIAGGENAGGVLSSVEIFDPETGTFSAASLLSSPRKGHAAARLLDGRVVIAGGFTGGATLTSIDVFDPAPASVSPLSASLGIRRAGLSATTLLDGKVLFFGGNDGSNDLASSEILDPIAGTITAVATAPARRRDHQAFLLPNNNTVLIVGGVTDNAPSTSAQLYLPWLNQFWQTGAPAESRYRATGSALSKESYGTAPAGNGLLAIAGGDGRNSAEVYGFATISVDKDDYSPGQTVYVSGSGWQPGEVTFDLQEVIPEHAPSTYTLAADEHGNISNQALFVVGQHHIGVRFYLTARDAASQAQITFTDSNPQSIAITPASVSVAPGSAAVYTVTLTVGGNTNACNVTLTASGVPSGASATFGTNPLVTTGSSSSPVTTSLTVNTTGLIPNGSFPLTVSGVNSGAGCQGPGPTSGSATLLVRRVGTVTVGTQSGTLTTGTAGSATYLVTVDRNGATGTAFTANLGVTSSLPAGATVSFSPSAVSFAVGETSKTSTLTITTTAATPSGSTAFTVRAANSVLASDASSASGTLTIGAAATTTTTASNATAIYGDALVTLSATVAPSTVNAGTVTFTIKSGSTTIGTATSGTVAGSAASATFSLLGINAAVYTIEAAYSGATGFNASNNAGQSPAPTLTVNKKVLTITASSHTVTYGDAAPTVTASYAGFITGDNAGNSLSTQPTCTTTYAQGSAAGGSYTTSCSGAVSTNYAPSYVNGTVTVNKKGLTITASSHTVTYGDVAPSVTPAFAGFVLSDNAANSLSTQPTCSTTYTAGSPVSGSPYQTSCTGAVSINYAPSYVNGTVTVNKAALTITASSHTVTYGDAAPTVTPAFAGFVLGQDHTALSTPPTCTTTYTQGSAAGGSYPTSCAGATAANYEISYVAGVVTVNKAALTITASSHTVTYGEAAPTVTPTFAGFVLSDNAANSLSTQPTCTTTYTQGSAAGGSYTTSCAGAAADNYEFSYVAGAVTVNKAALTITASSHTVTYGDPAPTVTPTFAGFVLSDNAANSLSTQPTCSTTYTAGSPVSGSPYPTSCTGAAADNYEISYVAGAVTVNKAALTITASSHTVTYGDPAPTVTPTFAGFVLSDNAANSLSTQLTCSTTYTAGSPVSGSPYPTSCTGAAADNYEISYLAGAVTVNKKGLTITASSHTVSYGDPAPTVTASYAGFITGDNEGNSLSTQPTCTTTYTQGSAAGGSYTTSCSGAVSTNYAPSYVNGTVTVNKKALSVTANNKSKVYGASTPAFDVAYSGFISGEGPGNLTGTLGFTFAGVSPTVYPSSVSVPNNPGTYSITPGGLTSVNYAITFIAGQYTITYGTCSVGSGGVILPPINSDGTSVYQRKGGSTIPVKFRVCDAAGQSISNPAAVFSGTVGQLTMLSAVRAQMTTINETGANDIPDAAFRWDASGQQWIFNMGTSNLEAATAYTFRINLANGSIVFKVGMK